MITMEQKVDLVLRYIAATNDSKRSELKERIVEVLKDGAISPAYDTPPSIEELTADLLKEVGVPVKPLGHGYIVCAIKLVISDRTYIRNITTRLYPDVAAQYGTTASRVERNIRRAVEVAFDRCDYEILYNRFGSTPSFNKGKLTNSEFIAACVDEISRRAKKYGVEVA